jgi:tetratricopeptide (TPR) repeat protein
MQLTPCDRYSYVLPLMRTNRTLYRGREPKRTPGPREPAALGLALLLLLGSAGYLPAAGTGAATMPLEEGRSLLETATDAFFDQSADSATLRALLDKSRGEFLGLQDVKERDYWLAEVEYLYGFVEQGDNRSAEAERRFASGRDLTLQSIAAGASSQAYRLLADIYAQLLILNGLLYKMSYGPKVKELAQEALRLDPGNAKARLTLALFYRNAPAIAGGSDVRSLQLLHDLERVPDLERVDRFAVNAWLGISYSEKKRSADARRYLGRALAVYPGNTWLRGLLADLPS